MHDISQSVADSRDGQDGEIVTEWRDLAEQRAADDLDEIEQEIVVDDEPATAGNLVIVPKDGRNEKRKLHDVANEKLDVAEPRADEAQHHDDPESVDEQQDDPWNREQARPSEG